LELTHGEGKNNGTVNGTSYFTCPKGKGVFVQLGKIVALRPARKGHTIQHMVRKPIGLFSTFPSSHTSGQELQLFVKEKYNCTSTVRSNVTCKVGSRETGQDNYYAVKVTPKEKYDSLFKERSYNVNAVRSAVPRKLGPRDIGRIYYDAADFPLEESSESFLKGKCSSRSTACKVVRRKPGPREIGWSDYDVATFPLEEPGQSFLEAKSTKVSNKRRVERKLGPRDIGRIKYDAYEYKDTEDTFLKERFPKRVGELSGKFRIERKLGPREIGWSDYKPAKFDYEDARGDSFLKKKLDIRRVAGKQRRVGGGVE